MAKNSAAGLLTSLDDLFTTQEERDEAQKERVTDISLSEISDFPQHPFKVRMDDSMTEMTESVRQYGVLAPALVCPKEDGGYEMVAGHRRKAAMELAGLDKLPCIVRDLTDDEAIIIMVDSNLQREKVLPSEKAFAYKMKLEAMKRQGQRTDLTSPPLVEKLSGKAALSTSQIGRAAGESHEQVRRYIRLTNLTPDLLDLVDENKIALRPAVELSYLSETEQSALKEVMTCEDCTPSHAQAIKMRKFAEEGKLNPDDILSIMQEEKPNQIEHVKIPRKRLEKYFPAGTPAQKIEDTIVKVLEMYRKRERAMER